MSGEDQTISDSKATVPMGTGAGGASGEELASGTKISKYVIKGLLGRGGMGAVYEAMDIALQRPVAMKVLPKSFVADEIALKRFIREAQLAARLNHPNAVTVFDVGKKGEIYFISMELVRGGSAQDRIDGGKPMPFDEATRCIADSCRALSAAHKAGLIHRDIKPDNIMLADDGTVKVADFGLAKGVDSGNQTITAKDAVLGTPKYMSPEQCQNEKVDARTDIYSLGGTYYTLLTGRAPFERTSALQVLYAHCTEPVPDPRDSTAALPADCTRIVFKAMAKSPDERYQSADEMLADLEAVLRGAAMSTSNTALNELAASASTGAGLPSPAMRRAAGNKPASDSSGYELSPLMETPSSNTQHLPPVSGTMAGVSGSMHPGQMPGVSGSMYPGQMPTLPMMQLEKPGLDPKLVIGAAIGVGAVVLLAMVFFLGSMFSGSGNDSNPTGNNTVAMGNTAHKDPGNTGQPSRQTQTNAATDALASQVGPNFLWFKQQVAGGRNQLDPKATALLDLFDRGLEAKAQNKSAELAVVVTRAVQLMDFSKWESSNRTPPPPNALKMADAAKELATYFDPSAKSQTSSYPSGPPQWLTSEYGLPGPSGGPPGGSVVTTTNPTPSNPTPNVGSGSPRLNSRSITDGYPPNAEKDPMVRALADLEVAGANQALVNDLSGLKTTVTRLLELGDYAQSIYDSRGFPPHMARVGTDAKTLADRYIPGASSQPRTSTSQAPEWLLAYGKTPTLDPPKLGGNTPTSPSPAPSTSNSSDRPILSEYAVQAQEAPVVKALVDLSDRAYKAHQANDKAALGTEVAHLLTLGDYAKEFGARVGNKPPHFGMVYDDTIRLARFYMPPTADQTRPAFTSVPGWMLQYNLPPLPHESVGTSTPVAVTPEPDRPKRGPTPPVEVLDEELSMLTTAAIRSPQGEAREIAMGNLLVFATWYKEVAGDALHTAEKAQGYFDKYSAIMKLSEADNERLVKAATYQPKDSPGLAGAEALAFLGVGVKATPRPPTPTDTTPTPPPTTTPQPQPPQQPAGVATTKFNTDAAMTTLPKDAPEPQAVIKLNNEAWNAIQSRDEKGFAEALGSLLRVYDQFKESDEHPHQRQTAKVAMQVVDYYKPGLTEAQKNQLRQLSNFSVTPPEGGPNGGGPPNGGQGGQRPGPPNGGQNGQRPGAPNGGQNGQQLPPRR
ncbi:MAG: protein kinase [Phycisphaera sp.]|nr:protein kinase [Phycisphaera sp.]